MIIRLAKETDIEKIGDLLSQVDLVHHNGRPDIFKIGKKYNDEQIREMLKDKDKLPDDQFVFIPELEEDYRLCGYATTADSNEIIDVSEMEEGGTYYAVYEARFFAEELISLNDLKALVSA